LTTIPSPTAIPFKRLFLGEGRSSAYWPKQMNGQPSESASIIKGFVTHLPIIFQI
jgi:putative Holliday junction resolvase